MTGIRPAAVAGRFYPAGQGELNAVLDELYPSAQTANGVPAFGAIVPHAGLIYSGACAAMVLSDVAVPATVVIVAPNHTGRWDTGGGASLWEAGCFATPVGDVPIAEEFAGRLTACCELVAADAAAHRDEHAIEVELPLLLRANPDVEIVPIALAWDDWLRCRELAHALAGVIADGSEDVLVLASSDMNHFESAAVAEQKDRLALAAVEDLDGETLLAVCAREHITMCGRAPAAVALETSRILGATAAAVVDYRHSGLVTGDDSSVVAYAGVVIR